MSTKTYLTMYRGDQKQLTATVSGLDAGQLTGASARFIARRRLDDPTPLIERDTASGLTIDAEHLAIKIVLQSTDTIELPNETVGLIFDVEIDPSDNSGPITAAQGRLTVYPNNPR